MLANTIIAKASHPTDIKAKRSTQMVSMMALAAGAVGFVSGKAHAQAPASIPDGYSAVSGLADVSSFTLEADGSVRLIMSDGRVVVVKASDVAVFEGVVYIDTTALAPAAANLPAEAAASGGGGGGAAIGLLAGLGGLGAAAGGGGGGGGGSSAPAPAPPPPPPPPPNAAPVFTSGTSASFAENATGIAYTATATDSDGDTLTYSISGGPDSTRFTIDSNTGEIRFSATPDFENPIDNGADNTFQITVRVSDGTAFVDQTVTITVTNVNEAPIIASGTAFQVTEGNLAAFTAAATDPEGTSIIYSLEGADASLFTINSSTGAVSFNSAPDFETPADADTDNVYELTLVASDGSLETRQNVTVTVTNTAESGVTLTSPATSNVSENQNSAYVIAATSDTNASITYSISGTDAGLFAVDSTTGEVRFLSVPNFESPADAGGDNVYDIIVTATDSSGNASQAVSITVSDVTEGVDVAGSSSTQISMVSGGSYVGNLEIADDTDWIAIELVAGQRYQFDLFGSGSEEVEDPYLRLRDSSGNVLIENDDISLGTIRDSQLSFTATYTGTYYIEADSWDGGTADEKTGQYTIEVKHTDPLGDWTTQQIADYLNQNGWGGAQWNIATGGTLTVDITALTSAGQFLARAALDIWSDATGLNFQEVSSNGDITFDDDQEGAFAGPTSIVGGFFQGMNVNVGTEWLDTYGTDINSYSFQTYVHEIGHALGLGHSGPYDGSATYGVDNIYLNDSWQISVMSYFSQSENTNIDATYAFVLTPQLADLVAVHDMYGAPVSVRDGNTVYGFNSNAGNAIFDATSFTTITSYTIIDSGGIDTMDYSGSNANQVLDLRTDFYSSVQGGTGNVAIAIGTVIENAIGGNGNDTLVGNAADNTLTGNNGDDIFYASGGSDVFIGGAGSDTAIFTGASSDYALSTNGSGNTVVTDLRTGSPDGVVELIGVETISYGGVLPDSAIAPEDGIYQSAGYAFDVEDYGARGCACSVCTSKETMMDGAANADIHVHNEGYNVDWMDYRVPLIDHDRLIEAENMTHLTNIPGDTSPAMAMLDIDWEAEIGEVMTDYEVALPDAANDTSSDSAPQTGATSLGSANQVSAAAMKPDPLAVDLGGDDEGQSPLIDPAITPDGWV